MKWQGRQRSSNIEDRRGAPGANNRGFGNPFGRGTGTSFRVPGGRTGGSSIGGIIVIVVILGIIWFATGQNPLDMLTGSSSTTTPSISTDSRGLPQVGEDEMADFVGVVIKETENTWTEKFAAAGQRYEPATVVLFTDATESACGVAQAASGPFYCPNDQKVYIDLTFYDQLRQQFGAPGDFAQAYVLAHEIGHHVQALEGTLGEFNDARAQMSQTDINEYSVRVELQADCYAGVWANDVGRQNLLDQDDVEEAITAANAIGDDTLTRGTVSPRNFTHGTSEQRMKWLRIGMESGNPADCDTFSGNI